MSERLHHLSALFAAIMTVVATGEMPRTPDTARTRKAVEGVAAKTYVKNAPPRAELLPYCDGQYRRVNYSAIARDLGVTPQHVRRVFLGLANSARVMEAIKSHLSGGAA